MFASRYLVKFQMALNLLSKILYLHEINIYMTGKMCKII